MGYETRYSLQIQHPRTRQAPPLDFLFDLIEQLRNESEEALFCLDDCGNCREPGKWYEHEQDLKGFSARHPDFLFTLRGEGEEAEDVWSKYFVAGKIQVARAKVSIEDFDPDNLT